MSYNRPTIPESMKRALRQESYFGCVLCGNPIIEYHHIEPYHKVKCHEKSNLVVLCPEHHHRANCGEIFKKKVIEAKNNPYNKHVDFVEKDFFLQEYKNLNIITGSNIFSKNQVILEIENKSLLTIKSDDEGYAVLSAEFYGKNNILLANIKDNEWKAYKGAKLWDITYSPGHLIIKTEKGKILLELKLINDIIELRAEMTYNNYTVSFKPNKTIINDITITGGKFNGNSRDLVVI